MMTRIAFLMDLLSKLDQMLVILLPSPKFLKEAKVRATCEVSVYFLMIMPSFFVYLAGLAMAM